MGTDFLTKLGTALRAERKKAGLTPAAVRKMREIVFDWLMRMMPHSGNT